MINFIDEVLASAPKYTITHADTTTEEVSIDLATTVTTQGTPLNKALFDSIKDDLDARLLIADKATNNDAITGTNTSKYIVPATLQAKLDNMNAIQGTNSTTITGESGIHSYTIYEPSMISSTDTGTVTIYGLCTSTTSTASTLTINGTDIGGVSSLNLGSGVGISLKTPFKVVINYNTKVGEVLAYTSSTTQGMFRFSTITDIKVQMNSGSSNISTCTYSIAYSR